MNSNNKYLEIEIWKAKAETWKEAFALLAQGKNTAEKIPQKPFSLAQAVEEEAKATNFVNDELMPKLEQFIAQNPKPEGEVASQGVWLSMAAEFIWSQIKDAALIFIVKTLEDLKERAAEWIVEGAKWVLDQFQQVLYEKFQQANTEEEKTLFKNKIIENFPETQLAKRLGSEN